jgi:hypothetical protein
MTKLKDSGEIVRCSSAAPKEASVERRIALDCGQIVDVIEKLAD